MFGLGGKDAGDGGRRGGIVSVIGADVVITGDVASADALRIDGRIDGNVRCGALDQGAGGVISGDIEAEEARIAGRVEGKVAVTMLAIEASAQLCGDVSYRSLSIAAGARIDGRLSHRPEPAAAAAAAPAPAKPRAEGAVAELFAQAAE